MKKGGQVTIVVETPGVVTESTGIIQNITESVIYIEALKIPFDKITGIKTETFPGVKVYIKEIYDSWKQ